MLKVLFYGHEKDFADYEELKVYMEENPDEMISGINFIAEGEPTE